MIKIRIIGEIAHFKIPLQGKLQKTYNKPPISTIVGILENLFGKGIDNFEFGCLCRYKSVETEFNAIYKEVDGRENSYTSIRRFKKDNFITEYLREVEIIIYTDIEKEIELKEPLTLGKANCLGTIVNFENGDFEKVDLIKKDNSIGYNQWTSLEVGTGMPVRINTITKFSKILGAYEYKTQLVRESKEFERSKFYDEEEDEAIFIWKWKEGVVNAAD